MTKPKRPRDPNQLAKLIVGIATGEVEDDDPRTKREPEATQRGRAGGLKGGAARASKLTSAKRAEIAKKAAAARWNKK